VEITDERHVAAIASRRSRITRHLRGGFGGVDLMRHDSEPARASSATLLRGRVGVGGVGVSSTAPDLRIPPISLSPTRTGGSVCG